MHPKISIVIRAKNEEKWIGICLQAIHDQNINSSYETILVDSGSTDRTIDKAYSHGITKVVQITNYKPGLSINEGVRASEGSIIVLLSAHCVPSSKTWLRDLTDPLLVNLNTNVCACYGRQLPTPGSNPNDVRDLLITFGIEDKIQSVDTFFHNANSAFLKETWDNFPFDEDVTNIEDRIWSENVIKQGFKIYYSSSASVFHWHGIHQYGNSQRALTTAQVLKEHTNLYSDIVEYQPLRSSWIAFIPIDNPAVHWNEIVENLAKNLSSSPQHWVIIVCSYIPPRIMSNDAIRLHWIDRNIIDNESNISMISLLKRSVELYEDRTNEIADNIAIFNIAYAFRDINDVQNAIDSHVKYDNDITYAEYHETENSTSIEDRITFDIKGCPISILESSHRKIDSTGILLPGYFTLVHASCLRLVESVSIRIENFVIYGQQKLLKIENLTELAILKSIINQL